ncbi:MAG: hypothetical protein WAL75_04290 [Terracidiphilus sp.]
MAKAMQLVLFDLSGVGSAVFAGLVTVKSLNRVALLSASISISIMFLSSCGPDTPPEQTQLRGDFADAALPVLNKIERAHQHDLNIGEETPEAAIDGLRSNAHSDN